MPRKRTDMNASPTGETANDSKRRKARVPIYKNDDGTLDLSGLTDEDAEKVRQRFASGSTTDSTAAAPAAPPPPQEPIDPAIIGLALNLLTSIEAAVVGTKLNIPIPEAYQVLSLKPPFDQLVTNAACKVANKYVGSLGPYADEIALVALLATWQIGAFAELRKIVADQAKTPGEKPPPPMDHDRHRTTDAPPPPPAAAPPKPAPAKPQVVPIDVMLGAQLGGAGFGAAL